MTYHWDIGTPPTPQPHRRGDERKALVEDYRLSPMKAPSPRVWFNRSKSFFPRPRRLTTITPKGGPCTLDPHNLTIPLIQTKNLPSSTAIPSFVPVRRSNKRKLLTNSDFGCKGIGQFGSYVYLVNQIFGTGVIAVPNVVRAAGWLPCLLTDMLVAVCSALSSLMLLRCMTLVKNNRDFERRLEYISVMKYYLRKRLFRVVEFCFYVCVQSQNLISIIVVSQAIDSLFVFLFGSTGALQILPSLKIGIFSEKDIALFYDSKSSFHLGISLGHVINSLICLPLSAQTMEENMKIQYVSFVFLMGTLGGLVFSGVGANLATTLIPFKWPSLLGKGNFGELMSTFLASFAYVNMVPSWANEMSYKVDVSRAILNSSLTAFAVYFIFGTTMSSFYPQAHTDNVLQEVLSARHNTWARALVYAFDLITITPGILAFTITTRYNLINSGSCNYKTAFLLSSVGPFLFGWMFMNNRYFSFILSWSSLIFSLIVNFIAPCVVFLIACCISRSHHEPTTHWNWVQRQLRVAGWWIAYLCGPNPFSTNTECTNRTPANEAFAINVLNASSSRIRSRFELSVAREADDSNRLLLPPSGLHCPETKLDFLNSCSMSIETPGEYQAIWSFSDDERFRSREYEGVKRRRVTPEKFVVCKIRKLAIWCNSAGVAKRAQDRTLWLRRRGVGDYSSATPSGRRNSVQRVPSSIRSPRIFGIRLELPPPSKLLEQALTAQSTRMATPHSTIFKLHSSLPSIMQSSSNTISTAEVASMNRLPERHSPVSSASSTSPVNLTLDIPTKRVMFSDSVVKAEENIISTDNSDGMDDDEDIDNAEQHQCLCQFNGEHADAYTQDADIFGEIHAVRIHVFPKGFFRIYHVEATVIVLIVLVGLSFATALSNI